MRTGKSCVASVDPRRPTPGEVQTHDDGGTVHLYVECETLGRGLVFLNLDCNTEEDDANIETDIAKKGWSD